MAKREPDASALRQPVVVPASSTRSYFADKSWLLVLAVILVIGVYASMAHSGVLEVLSPTAADTDYNLLVQGFRAGQLNLKKEVPPGLAQLADPYDPSVRPPFFDPVYRMNDLSYYKGRFYLYFGVTPALILFWPYVALTGHYLFHRQAVTIFCTLGFLVSVGLLRALWRRYFTEVSVGVVAACAFALGLATGAPVLLSQSDVYEVVVSCGYMLTMLALGAIWCALHEPERKGCWWLAAASLSYGLAVGARPNLLFGMLILLVPVVQARRERKPMWALLMAAIGPITLVGLGLMLYNAMRFDNPFEFGWHYQLTGDQQNTVQPFSLLYLWFNFRSYFLEPARWSAHFPFVHKTAVPFGPGSHVWAETPFSLLTDIPLAWLALGVPLAWRNRSRQVGSVLRWFVTAAALLFGTCALTLGFFWAAVIRYEVDFLPALLLLAVVGILGLERVLADRPVRRRAVRWGWGLLVGFSMAINLLASVENYAFTHNNLGVALEQSGKHQEAVEHYKLALRFNPDFPDAHYNLGNALDRAGRIREAISEYYIAVQINQQYAEAHNNLGGALLHIGRVREAIGHYEQALRIKPDSAVSHCNLANALSLAGNIEEAIRHYEPALRIKPDYAEAHSNLGLALWRTGTLQEAIGHYEQALRIRPDFAEAHYNLGNALVQAGRVQDGIGHYEQALRIKPDYAEAHNNLGAALEQAGGLQDAIGHYEQALRIKPDYAQAHYNLGDALERVRRVPEAIAQYEQALRLKPDYAEAHNNLGSALLQLGRSQEAIGHFEQALRLKPDLVAAKRNLARVRAVQ